VLIYIIIDSVIKAVAPPQRVLLVLPVAPATADEGEQLIAEGLTEDIIQTIGHAPDLRIIAPASAFNSRAGSKTSRNGTSSPATACATISPHANPSTLPWPE